MAPAGSNSKNFANCDVIIRLAVEAQVDAVYVGWGHASENPELCRRLELNNIIFIGPSEKSIIASGTIPLFSSFQTFNISPKSFLQAIKSLAPSLLNQSECQLLHGLEVV